MPPAKPDTPLVIDNTVLTHWRTGHEYVNRAFSEYYRTHEQLPALTSVIVYESVRGFRRDASGEVEGLQMQSFDRTMELIESMVVLSFDLRAAQIAAAVFRRLPANRRTKLANDLFIAATALANGCSVATGNRKDFELIESLLPANFGPYTWRFGID